jgi:hypothetical protein
MHPAIVDANRRALHSVEQWIRPEDYESSRAHYGCPPELVKLLDAPINQELICTDLLVMAAHHLNEPLNYLEIGVSVGKNFYAMSQALRHSLLVGLDWERLNPTLASRFRLVHRQQPVSSFTTGRNMIRYVEGDLFREATWKALAGTRFQLIFSDAAHHPAGVLHEFEMLSRHGLLDPERLFILWDDLDHDPQGPMSQAFFQICDGLRELTSGRKATQFLMEVNGWLGEHEHRHTVGVFNTLGLSAGDLLQIED